MKKLLPLFTFLYCFTTASATDGGGNTVKAGLTGVTVYRIGAEMSHLAKAKLSQGNNELVIENISNSLDANSLQVNCNGNVTVMGIEFSTDHLQHEMKAPVMKRLEDSVETINASLEKIETNTNVINDLLSVLKANKEIKGTQAGLSVAELAKLMQYYRAPFKSSFLCLPRLFVGIFRFLAQILQLDVNSFLTISFLLRRQQSNASKNISLKTNCPPVQKILS